MSKIVLSEQDRQDLVHLYEEAEDTPCLIYDTTNPLQPRDMASDAWRRVRNKMDELGKKYGFDPRQIKGISKKTGEVAV